LVSLPSKHGVDVLKRSPKLQELIAEYIEGLPSQQKQRREFVVLSDLIQEAKR
jgi:hypothetical protein